MICPSCSSESPAGAKFCLECGTRLEVVPLPQGERRFVTVLFADVVDSTGMGERLDEEQVAEVMQGAFGFFNAAVDRFGGTVTRLMGDAVLAVFGAPQAHDDDPERAVQAGLAILESAEQYRKLVERPYDIEFRVRVGIHSGRAVLAMVGDQIKTEYTAMGDAANIAKRLQEQARPGGLLISGDTYHLVKNLFDIEPRGEVKLKGKSQPVVTYEVTGLRSLRGSSRGLDGVSSPLVGRNREVEILRDRFRVLLAGDGSCVAVVGEAGLGKSRLIAEVRAWAESLPDLLWLEGRALSYGQKIAYYPWRQVVRQALGLHETDPPAQQREQLRSHLPPDDVERFERLLGLEDSEQVAGTFGVRRDDRQLLVDAVRSFVATRAREVPLVVVLDDMHWADEPSLDLCARVADLVSSQRLLLIVLARPEKTAASWHTLRHLSNLLGENFFMLELEALDEAASQELLTNLLDVENMPRTVHDLILRKSDGNPFFIEEVIRSLIDSGHIVREGDRWRAAGDIEDVSIPDTLAGVLASRIDRLPDATKRVVQTASVIGRIFQYPVLSAVCAQAPAPERIADPTMHLGTLTDEGLVRERARDPDLEYIFKHALTQEAAYDLLLLRRRKEYHRRVGEILEQLYTAQLDDLAPILAHHFWVAEDWRRAGHYSLRAAVGAVKVYAVAEAVGHYDRAYEALRRVEDTPPWTLIDLVVDWAGFAFKLRPYKEIVERLTEMEALAREIEDTPRLASVLNWIGNVYVSAGFPGLGVPAITQSYQLADEIGDEKLTLLPTFLMTESLVDRSPREALGVIAHVIELSEKYDRPDIQSHALAIEALAHSRLGEFPDAMRFLRLAHQVVQRTDVPVKVADVHAVSALVSYDMGDIEAGLAYSESATRLASEAQAGECTLYAMYCTGLGNILKPDPVEARASFQRSLERVGSLRNEYLQYIVHSGLAIADSQRGDPSAVERLKTVFSNARGVGDRFTSAQVALALADSLLRLGDLTGAETYAQDALGYYRKNEMKPYIARALRSLAALRSRQGRSEEAAAAEVEAKELARVLADALATIDAVEIGALS